MIRRTFLVLFNMCSVFCFSQTIKNVQFEVKENKMVVNYDLVECRDNFVYEIGLKFKSETGDIVYPGNAKGDIGKVSPGEKKEIIWEPLSENKNISGQVAAVVEVTRKKRIRSNNGSSVISEFDSMLADINRQTNGATNSSFTSAGRGAYSSYRRPTGASYAAKKADLKFSMWEFSVYGPNHKLEPGDTSYLKITLQNIGSYPAINVNTEFYCNSPFVKFLSRPKQYADILGSRQRSTHPALLAFTLSPSTPVGTQLTFRMMMSDKDGNTWSDSFDLTVR